MTDYNVSFSKSEVTVPIKAQTVEEDLDFEPTVIKLPVMFQNQDTNASTSKVLDLKMIFYSLTVKGFIVSDGTSSALEKKQALIARVAYPSNPLNTGLGIFRRGGSLTFVWRGETFTDIALRKIKFTDDAKRAELNATVVGHGTRGESPERYEITVSLVVGEVQG